VALRLGVDPKHADQMVRGTVISARSGRQVQDGAGRGSGEKLKEAQERAPTTSVATTWWQGRRGWTDFDAMVATPDMMKSVGKLGKVLGPAGSCEPEDGTVTFDVGKAVARSRRVRSSIASTRPRSSTRRWAVSLGRRSCRERDRADRQRDQGQPASAKGKYVKPSPSPRRWVPGCESISLPCDP